MQAATSVAADYAGSLQRGAPEAPPVVLRKLFERLGSTYIKLGQFIASRCAAIALDALALEMKRDLR